MILETAYTTISNVGRVSTADNYLIVSTKKGHYHLDDLSHIVVRNKQRNSRVLVTLKESGKDIEKYSDFSVEFRDGKMLKGTKEIPIERIEFLSVRKELRYGN